MKTKKFCLTENQMPTQWYNIVADMPNKPLPPLEILRAFAVFRFVLPKAQIRTAGGREVNLRDLQALALNGGASGIMIGGYLTTAGRGTDRDMQMLKDLDRPRSMPNLD